MQDFANIFIFASKTRTLTYTVTRHIRRSSPLPSLPLCNKLARFHHVLGYILTYNAQNLTIKSLQQRKK